MKMQAAMAAKAPAGALHHRSGDIDTVDLSRRGGEDHRQQSAAAEADLQHAIMLLEIELFQRQPVHLPADSVEPWPDRSEEHTSELQSLMRISYAVFRLTKKSTKEIRQ